MDYKKLGKRIKAARNKMSMSQEKLAEKIGLSSVYISHIETGTTKPSIDTLVNICNQLGITPDYVLFDSVYNSKEYLRDEIASLLNECSENDYKLIVKLIKAVIDK